MGNSNIILEIANWSSPLTYVYLIMGLAVLATVQVIIKANQYAKEESGSALKITIFDFTRLLNWTSKNERKLYIIVFLIVLTGILWALSFTV